MNREIKRRMKREEKRAEKARRRQPPVPSPGQRKERVRIRQFLREIQAELRRVIWPTAQEVITYSIVVVVVVTLITGIVFLLDLGFARGMIELFNPAQAQ